jgi:hypothetical protein
MTVSRTCSGYAWDIPWEATPDRGLHITINLDQKPCTNAAKTHQRLGRGVGGGAYVFTGCEKTLPEAVVRVAVVWKERVL